MRGTLRSGVFSPSVPLSTSRALVDGRLAGPAAALDALLAPGSGLVDERFPSGLSPA